LKKDLAAASGTGIELANSSRGYQRMRFVSEIEQPKASTPVQLTKAPHKVTRPKVSNQALAEKTPEAAPDPKVEVASEPTVTESTPPAPAPDPTPSVVVAPRPSPQPVNMPASGGSGSGASGGSGGGGIGEAIGVIIGTVIIRGGAGGVDKCDPRTDGRGRGTVNRPEWGLPLPSGGGVYIGRTFPSPRRR
jgi:hypothetical protein